MWNYRSKGVEVTILAIGLTMLCLYPTSCKKDDSKTPPGKAILLFPRNNELCTDSQIISETQNKIVFKWQSTEHTDGYDLVLKDLETGSESTRSSEVNSLELTLKRANAYSWYVVSKSAKNNKSTNSAVWKFYNPGPALTSYSPFPADLIEPLYATVISPSSPVDLKWKAVDLDNDIESYDVHLGLNQTPPVYKAKLAETFLSDLKLDRGKTYFWKVVTADKKGNKSHSDVYMFKLD